jgi:hypothetical protein
LHAAFGVAKRGQAGVSGVEQQEILRELVVQKRSGVGARGAHHAKVWQGASAEAGERG